MLFYFQDVQNSQAQKENLLSAVAKRPIADIGNKYNYTPFCFQDVQNIQAQRENLLLAIAKRPTADFGNNSNFTPFCVQDVQNIQAQKENLLPAVAKRLIADFQNRFDHLTWTVTHVGNAEDRPRPSVRPDRLEAGTNRAIISLNGRGNLRFRGKSGNVLTCFVCISDASV